MSRRSLVFFSFLAAAALSACAADDAAEASPAARWPGGETTVVDRTSQAYGKPAANLAPETLDLHLDGDLTFEAQFVTAPAEINPGLGPTYNNVSCARCHVRDGRGMPVVGDPLLGSHMLVRVSLPAGEPAAPGGAVAVPGLGVQLQDHGVYGQAPEARVELTWREHTVDYGDATRASLRAPGLVITRADGTPLPEEVMTSLRQPPPVFGLGLLEAVPEADIRALADPDDEDGDGISGRANTVWDPELGAPALGRFGHKANTSSLRVQAAAAYFNDMGVSNLLFPDAEGHTDVDAESLDATTHYTRTLGVPAPGEGDFGAGETLFRDFGCADCHVETQRTGEHPVAELSHQTIRPYTDLLLHDLGEGLADGRPDFEAGGREWRTPPLWGVGLTHTVLPESGFLHDGRARTLAEAILWHGGEAEKAREAFRTADAADRAALLAFLGSR